MAKLATNAISATWWPKFEPQCKWCHLVAKFVTIASDATWWYKNHQLLAPYKQAMQVAPSGGQIYNQCKYCHLVTKIVTIYKLHHLLVKLRTNTTCITSDATFKLISVRKKLSYRVNTLSPLCNVWNVNRWSQRFH